MKNQNEILDAFMEMAEILRGTLAAHEIAELPATLLFLKCITDYTPENEEQTWLSNYPKARAGLEKFSWNALAGIHPGDALIDILRRIENNIPFLAGLSEQSSLAHLATRAFVSERTVRRIFDRLNTISLDGLSQGDVANLFQRLLDGMEDHAVNISVTPISIRQLLVQLLDVDAKSSVYDPVCGCASLLCEVARHRREAGIKGRFYGQEINPGVALIAKMNAVLNNLDFDIRIGDTLKAPKHIIQGKLQKFDVVLANPPFGSRVHWGSGDFGSPEFVRPLFLESGIIQHVAETLSDYGMGAVLVPNGFLFRGGSDHKIRQDLIEKNRIHAIISLPANLFRGTAIAASVLVLNGPQKFAQEQRVIFVDLRSFADGHKTQKNLSKEGISIGVSCVAKAEGQNGICSVVGKDELLANDCNLSASRYITHLSTPERSFEEELSLFISTNEERDRVEKIAISLLKAINFEHEEEPND